MPTLPIRDLGAIGVISDVSPYNIPINAFSTGINVRFDEGKVSRAPIFRKVKDSLGFTPRFAMGITQTSGYDKVVMVADDWAIKEYASGTVTDRSGSITGSSDPRPFTGTTLAGLTYINRADRIPVYRNSSTNDFADLPNWDSTWKAGALRSYNDQLVALNILRAIRATQTGYASLTLLQQTTTQIVLTLQTRPSLLASMT